MVMSKAPAPRSRRRSTAAVVHEALRAEILSIRRRPGDPISEADIARAHGVSRTPVREAVLRLANEGLIVIYPQSGTYVAPIPFAQLPEAIEVRRALERVIVETAALRVDEAGLSALQAEIARQERCGREGDDDEFYASDEAFHAGLADIAGLPRFWEVVLGVKVQVDRARRITLPMTGRMVRVLDEHRAIVAAVRQRNRAKAGAAMDEHLDSLLTAIAAQRT